MLAYALIALIILTVPAVYADDEFEEDEERGILFGDSEEREDEEEGVNAGIANIILYITIAAVVGTGGYVLWKISSMRAKVRR